MNVANSLGETALVLATKDSNKWDVVRELITHKNVDLNVCGRFGYTVLMWATHKSELKVVNFWLPSVPNNSGGVAGNHTIQ